MVYFGKGFLGKKKLLRKLFCRTLELTGNKVDKVMLCLKMVSSEEIKELNSSFRGVNQVTDVLSFPMLNIKEGEKLASYDAEREPNGVLQLGDIVLCREKVAMQAKEYGHSFKRELCFLVVHGYLHLLGYDHMNPEEEKRMMNVAENVLLNFGLERKNV